MLKKSQLTRDIQKALKGRSDLEYKQTLRNSSYFLCPGEEGREPRHRWFRLEIEDAAKELVAYSGVSYFETAQEVALAPSFTTWRKLDYPEFPARSKQTLRKSLKSVLNRFQPTTEGRFASLSQMAADPTKDAAISFFRVNRQALQDNVGETLENLKRLTGSGQYQELCRLARLGEIERDDEELEALLGSFAEEGTYSGSAGFSLNQDKALAKLTDFQLGERYLFPLFLASGLYLMGAEKLDIRLDSDEIWVAYEGCRIDVSILKRLPSALLSPNQRFEEAGLRKLAQALLQSVGRNPSRLEWRCGDAVVELLDFPELENIGTVETNELTEGEFYSKLPFGLGVAKRFLGSLSGPHEEEISLKDQLAYLPIPWALNGDDQQLLLQTDEETLIYEWVDEGASCELGLQEASSLSYKRFPADFPAHLVFTVNSTAGPALTVIAEGIVVECPQQWPDDHLRGFLWVKNLATDLSSRNLVQTRALEELLESVKAMRAEVEEQIPKCYHMRSEDSKWAWTNVILKLLSAERKRWGALASLPCLSLVGVEERTTIQACEEAHSVFYTDKKFERGLRTGSPVVELVPGQVVVFKKLFPEAFEMTLVLQSTQDYYERLERWLKLPVEEAKLPKADYAIQVPIEGFEGEIGLKESESPLCKLQSQGRSLPVDTSDWVPAYVSAVVNCDDLEMNNEWNDIYSGSLKRSEAIRKAVEEAVIVMIDRTSKLDLEDKFNRIRVEALLTYLVKRGYSIDRWKG